METNELLNNEEVTEVREIEVGDSSNNSGNGLAIIAGFGIGVLGTLAYTKIIKPFVAKRKAKKEELKSQVDVINNDGTEIEE